MASRGHPKPGRHNSESDGGLSLLGALEAWLSFEGRRCRGWVCPRVGDLPDHPPPARTSCRSNLANHILVFFATATPALAPDVSSSSTPTTYHSNQWLSGSHLPYPGPVLLPDAPLPVRIFAFPTPFTLSLAIQPTTPDTAWTHVFRIHSSRSRSAGVNRGLLQPFISNAFEGFWLEVFRRPRDRAFDSGPFLQQLAVSKRVKRRGRIAAEVFPPLLSCAWVTIIHRGGTIVPYIVSGPIAAESSFSVEHSAGLCRYPSIEIPECPWCRASP